MNVDPWANNRIRLKVPEGQDDYINASPISLIRSKDSSKKRYIATQVCVLPLLNEFVETFKDHQNESELSKNSNVSLTSSQGPKNISLGHFWRMVWYEVNNEGVIVMLTQTHETGREKCFQYYPIGEDITSLAINEDDEFEDGFCASVKLMETINDESTRSTVRKFSLQSDGESKTIWHFLFSGWPDFLVPEDEDRRALVKLVEKSEEKVVKSGSPRIVHCSAGVGRSGTFIALDYLMRELKDGSLESVAATEDRIFDTVSELRQQRMMMVQAEAQYSFLYDVMRELWLERHDLPSSKEANPRAETPSEITEVTASSSELSEEDKSQDGS